MYIAASFPRRVEAAKLAFELRCLSHHVTSTWHNVQSADVKDNDLADAAKAADRDLQQVCEADAIVVLTGDFLTKGGRHTEFGIALALCKQLIIVGPRENVFHHHARVQVVVSAAELISRLTPVHDVEW